MDLKKNKIACREEVDSRERLSLSIRKLIQSNTPEKYSHLVMFSGVLKN